MTLLEKAKKLIEKDNLNSMSRVQELVWERVAISHLLRIEGYSTTKIGKLFNRDHSTIVHYGKLYDQAKNWDDYKEMETYVSIELDLENTEFDKELEELTLPERVVRCTSYWQFRKLREKVIDELSTIEEYMN